ncbi:MAG: VanZ family protein [Actinomycetota bacterium]
MLSTYLAAYPWLGIAALGVAVVVGLPLGWWLASRPSARQAWTLAAVAAIGVLAATLYPTGRTVEVVCVLGRDGTLAGPEPLANVALFVPIGLLVGLASRRPALGALAGAALTVVVELVQALVPAIGRSCAMDDAIANALGAALGAVLAAVALLLPRRRGSREGTTDDVPARR